MLSKELSRRYDGVLTFKFDGITDEINFFYKLSNDGLNLENLDAFSIKDNVAVARASSPMILFFKK